MPTTAHFDQVKRRGRSILKFFLLTMLAVLVVFYLAILYPREAVGSQAPMLTGAPPPLNENDILWDFDRRPSVNETGHLIFHSVGSLLQHWPNTLYRNGHNIVPGTVPAGTLLYHGSPYKDYPARDWVAIDPEHANFFCAGRKESGCWQTTLMTTRPLNILYFDGTSAGKMENGTMDSQDLVAWGKLRPECMFGERFRLKDLCEWGSKYNLDGFVRMEFNFEIMLCDINNGMEIVSTLNLQYDGWPVPIPPPAPTGIPLPEPTDCRMYLGHSPPPPPPPPKRDDLFIPDPAKIFLATESGTWHHHFPGVSRIKLDLTRLISFYDVDSFPSLVIERFEKPRWKHRLEGISIHDVDILYNHLEEVLDLNRARNIGSGVDWSAVVKVIMDRYGKRLEMLQYILQDQMVPVKQETNWTAIATHAHDYLTGMLNSYIVVGATPSSEDTEPYDSTFSWAIPVLKECTIPHTALIAKTFSRQLTPSERLILESVETTNQEICRVIVRTWAESVVLKLHGFDPEKLYSRSLREVVKGWERGITGLMDWLGWGIWVTCRPACGPEELCYLPTWPFFYPNPSLPQGPLPTPENPIPPEANGLPEPFCIRRLPPFPKFR